MNNKKTPERCEATLCCQATAALQIEVAKETTATDRCLSELLKTRTQDTENKQEHENKNT